MACDANDVRGHDATTTRKKLVFPIAIAAVMVDGFDLQMIGFVAPEIARSWGLDIQAFAPVFGAALAGSILGALIAGPAARESGQRLVLMVSLALFGTCTLVTWLIPSRATALGRPHEEGSGRLRDLFGNGLLTTTALLWTCSFAFVFAALSMAVLDVARAFPALLLIAACVCGLTGYGGSMSFGSLATLLYPPSLRVSGAGWVLGIGRLGAAFGPLCAGLALSRGLDIGSLFYFAAAAAAGASLCLMMLARMRAQVDTGVLR